MYLLVFRRYAPFATFGFGFEGDNRSDASTSLTATARTCGMLMFDRNSIGKPTGESSGTRFLGFGGSVADFLGKHYSNVKSSVTNKRVAPDKILFTASTEGGNPMVPGAPDIDTYVDFSAKWLGATVFFEGVVRGDSFPNAEVFVLDGMDKAVLLFNGHTKGGRQTGPFVGLPFAGTENRIGTFSTSVPIGPSDGFLVNRPSCAATKI